MDRPSRWDLLPNEEDRALVVAFEDAGQGHVFRFIEELSPTGLAALLDDARSVELGYLDSVSRSAPEAYSPQDEVAPLDAIRPGDADRDAAIEAGHDLLSAGEVAFLMVAGGQATRLGYEGPKGAYPIGPATGKSLFRWQAEKVIAASRRYDVEFLFFVMVSDATAESTARHFRENDWFGLEGRIHFVRQRMLPTVDEAGRILLAGKDRIALAPNGHGGVLEALERDGALSRMRASGVRMVSYFQVDNALLNAADPAFLGYHALRNADMSVKVVPKSHPLEKAGVVCLRDGVPGVLEYSELPDDLAHATDSTGELMLGLANIAAHVFSLSFLERVHGLGLPVHCAHKQTAALDDSGSPAQVHCRKYETFVFDAMPLASGLNVVVADRSEEFAPLKNKAGDDSPETVLSALLDRARSWFRRAGATVPHDLPALEISPLDGYDFESFCEHLRRDAGGGTT